MKKVLLVVFILFGTQIAQAQIITTIGGTGVSGYSGDGGQATSAYIDNPQGISCDASGNIIYFAESGNNVVRKINRSTGVISTIAGNGTAGYSGDGYAATNASLNFPKQIFIDPSGNLFIADADNHCIRKVNGSTGIISTIAGTGTPGYTGDGGLAINARFNVPYGVCLDNSGNIFIADAGNNVIRKVDAGTGIITTIVGNGLPDYSGDGGPASGAKLNNPSAVCVDAYGNIYMADTYNNRIRKVIAASGIINTIAGNDSAAYYGDGGPATAALLSLPSSVYIDASFNVYIPANNVIRKITASTGIINTIAGNGTAGFSGDGGLATNAKLWAPAGVCVDITGDVFISDGGNNRIREVTIGFPVIVADIEKQYESITLSPNPAHDVLTVTAACKITTIAITNLVGKTVFMHEYNNDKTQVNIAFLPTGVYFIRINNTEVRKFVKQ